MKILITGGAGFIGSNIADTYIADGHTVAIVDNMHHGFEENIPEAATFYKEDIRDLEAMRRVAEEFQPDVINHQAAIAEVVESVRNPVPTMEVNVQGTVNMLLVGAEVGIQKFLFASTGGAIYGAVEEYPINESVVPHPESPYGLSKLLGEHTIEYYARMHDFEYLIFRYPNVYGPRQDPKGEAGVVAIFTQLLRDGATPTIFGDGTKTRDYVYVEDIAAANRIGLEKGSNTIVNLGTGREISDQMVYDTIASHFPDAAKAKHKEVRPGEVVRSCLDAAHAKTTLDWQPQYTFEEGIAKYVELQAK